MRKRRAVPSADSDQMWRQDDPPSPAASVGTWRTLTQAEVAAATGSVEFMRATYRAWRSTVIFLVGLQPSDDWSESDRIEAAWSAFSSAATYWSAADPEIGHGGGGGCPCLDCLMEKIPHSL